MATQVQEQGPGPPDSAQLQQLLAVLRTMLSPLPKPNQAAQPTSAVTAGLGLVHKHCSHSVTRCPSPLILGRVSSSAYPQATPPSSWVGVPGVPGSPVNCQHDSGLVQPRWESEAPNSSISFSLLEAERRGLTTDALPALESSLLLGSINTLISHTEPSQVSPALPHHPTNGPQSPADQSSTTVETRSALPMPASLSHS